jgi:hypothetical protein
MILLMQRLHPDDLAGRLLAKQEWTHLNLPALAPYNQSIPLYNGGVKHWLCDEPLEANRSGREEPKEGSARSAVQNSTPSICNNLFQKLETSSSFTGSGLTIRRR